MPGQAYRWKCVALISLLLVVLAISAGCPATSSTGGQVSVNGPRKVEIQAPIVVIDPANLANPVQGGMSTAKMTVEPNKDQELRVGFYESEVTGSGPQWQASGWMAVVMSSLLLGVDITSYKFSIDVSGQVDGPSAGGLMTVTLLALLLGDTVKPEATMTGTINPDGTIGPVGYVPFKLEGAAKAGKKLVLIPLGQRYDFDFNTGENVDVVEKGRSLGLEVREVGDIYEAYEALTGKKLPKPEGIVDQQPQLSSGAFEKVKSEAKAWDSRYQEENAAFMRLTDAQRHDFQALADLAKAANTTATSYSQQGLMSGAYSKNVAATLYMSLASERANMKQIDGQGGAQGVAALRDHLKSVQSQVKTRLGGLVDRLKVETPKTSTDTLVLAEAYSNLARALGLVDLGDQFSSPDHPAEDDAERIKFLELAGTDYTLADQYAQVTDDALAVGLGTGTNPAPDFKLVARFAEILRQAAEANLNYFDAVIINDQARNQGVHPDKVKQEYQAVDNDYTLAVATKQALPSLKERLGTDEAKAYATLGAALAYYEASSAVVVKYYSLDVKMDNTGAITGVTREAAMIHMLDFAEKRSSELISVAQKTGNEPVHPIIYFDSAKINREGTVIEKIGGLESFWLSNLEAKLMAIFAGKYKIAR